MPRASRSKSPARKKSNASSDAPKSRKGEVLGEAELQANNEKVTTVNRGMFPSFVESMIASVAFSATGSAIFGVTTFVLADLVIYVLLPVFAGTMGLSILTKYEPILISIHPAMHEVFQAIAHYPLMMTLFGYFGVSYTFMSFLVSKYATHTIKAFNSACITYLALKSLKATNRSYISFDASTYLQDSFQLCITITALSGVLSTLGHIASPIIDDIIEKRGCEGRKRHVIN